MLVKCSKCSNKETLSLENWHCQCGGAWEPASLPDFNPDKINTNDYTIWRYGELMGLDLQRPIRQMGVGRTPLVPVNLFGHNVSLKLEYLSPSGSFKDRGVNAMVNQLGYLGVKTVVEDSSGNAGASLAAHAARFGIKAEIYVPEYASASKKRQIAVYGASIRSIQGSRLAVEKAAQAAIQSGVAYASHAYNPAYLVGQVTAAYELWEQLDQQAPDWVLCPVGQGGLLMGCWLGFLSLHKANLIQKLPRFVAIQAEKIAPLHHAFIKNLDDVPRQNLDGLTVAEGVAINQPVRGKRLLEALRHTGGKTDAVSEGDIIASQTTMAHMGFFVEPTSALVVAGFDNLRDQIAKADKVVLFLTGNGLKGKPEEQ
jgi:threonine synthase